MVLSNTNNFFHFSFLAHGLMEYKYFFSKLSYGIQILVLFLFYCTWSNGIQIFVLFFLFLPWSEGIPIFVLFFFYCKSNTNNYFISLFLHMVQSKKMIFFTFVFKSFFHFPFFFFTHDPRVK